MHVFNLFNAYILTIYIYMCVYIGDTNIIKLREYFNIYIYIYI